MRTEPTIHLNEGSRQNADGQRQRFTLPITFSESRFTPRISRLPSPTSRTTLHASRITHHVSRITAPASRSFPAFTLIELLIVISIITLLAGLTFPAVRSARISVMRARARAEMIQLQAAIERYKDKLGYYPPDNPGNWERNQLYYELLGTTNIGSVASPVYLTLDGSAQIKFADFPQAFPIVPPNQGVAGFMNCARPGRGDEVPNAATFLNGLKTGQFVVITNSTNPDLCRILVCGLEGPLLTTVGPGINPWRYVSSNPHYNQKSFDLWIDILAGGKTNRICNWSAKPLVVYYTSLATEYP